VIPSKLREARGSGSGSGAATGAAAQERNSPRRIGAAIPNLTVPEPKRDRINILGVLSEGKRGALPSFFPLTPLHTFFGLFSAGALPRIVAKKEKEKVKKWSNEYSETEAGAGLRGVTTFDHFFEFGIIGIGAAKREKPFGKENIP
jgi:hypothetical protein